MPPPAHGNGFAVTGAVHLARMVADSAAGAFAVLILVGMRDHLDRSILNIYIGNVQNFVATGVCKGISVRQQSQGLRTKFCIDSTLERAALELGFPEEIHPDAETRSRPLPSG